MARASYSDEDKGAVLAALDANGGNVARTARQMGVPRQTVQRWASGEGLSPAVPELRHYKKKELAPRLGQEFDGVVAAVPGAVERASLVQLATALGILVDKIVALDASGPRAAEGCPAEDEQAEIARLQRLAELFERSGCQDEGEDLVPALRPTLR